MSLRPELLAQAGLLGILAVDLSINYRLISGAHTDVTTVQHHAAQYIKAATTPGGALQFVVGPLLLWALLSLLYRIATQRKAADLVQAVVTGFTLYYFATEVLPHEEAISTLKETSSTTHETLLKIFWGHIVLTISNLTVAIISIFANPPPQHARIELLGWWVWLAVPALGASFYAPLFFGGTETEGIIAFADILTQTYMFTTWVPFVLGFSLFLPLARLFTSRGSARELLFIVFGVLQLGLFFAINQQQTSIAHDRKVVRDIAALKGTGTLFAAAAALVLIATPIHWGAAVCSKSKGTETNLKKNN